ncbi:hypothetical protein BDV93DRAFT_285536 [Ceratobasidium sp. AG-I]|nr:hypothetical protein BDV93DRAFT_285536 [Ceratobasidium sp. AG-I]
MTSRKDLSVSDRIAALQRGSSPQPQGDRHASPPGTTPSLPLSHSLKDKIAHFDALGTAPKPVGSFGLGAPPAPAEHRAVNRELYGNRIPSVNHKTGRSVSSGKELSQFASASTSSLDAHDRTDSRASSHASEGNNDATSPTGSAQGPPSAVGHSNAGVPEIRRTDSMTEHWVDDQHSKPAISLDLSSATAAVALAPPSPIPDSEDATFPSGPTTPLTSTLIRHLGTSSHVPSRLGNETPVSMMVETGSLVDGEQPNLVPEEEDVPVPSSPVVTGMQALGLSDGAHAEGETTPTREAELGALKTPDVPSDVSVASVAGSLAPPTISGPGDEGPNTPLARSVEVDEPVTVVSLADNSTESGLNLSTGEQAPVAPQGSELTASNVRQLNAEESGLAPSVRPSGPSSVVVEAGSVARSLQPSPAPQQAGAQTPEPVSALTPKQSLSELPTLGHGSVPLSAASLRLLNLEGGMKGGRRDGAETPMSVQVETGSADGRPRDLEGVDAPIATPAPASPAASYFEESKADVVMQPEQPRTDESETTKDTTSHANVANSEPDNRTFH